MDSPEPISVIRLVPYFRISKSLFSVQTWKGDADYYEIEKTTDQNDLLKRIAEESGDPNLAMLAASRRDHIALMRPIAEIQDTVKAFLRAAKRAVDPEKVVKLVLRFTNGTKWGNLTMGWRERMVEEGEEVLYEPLFDNDHDRVILNPVPRHLLREREGGA